jgi:hypothetical protein
MSEQADWARCMQCEALWFAAGVGSNACPPPANNPSGMPRQHSLFGTNYNLTYNVAPENFDETPGAQGGWAWCQHCGCLWFIGNGTAGHCAAGGGHTNAGSGAYLVAEAAGYDERNPNWEHGWRFCDKCQVLWYSVNGVGLCPAGPVGSGHSQAESGQNYVVKTLAGQPAVGTLDAWLTANPTIAASIVWEDQNGAHPWSTWTTQQKLELQQAFVQALSGSPIPVAEIPPNQVTLADTDELQQILAASDAWAYFKASVVQSLAIETTQLVGWSISGYSAAELAQLFDSRQMFRWNASPAGYQIYGGTSGLITPAPPAYTYELLLTTGLMGASRLDTMGNIVWWCHENLAHSPGGLDIPNVFATWQYRGFPPMVRVIEGTTSTSTSTSPGGWFGHFTAGCWGTTGLLIALGRAINIPVELVTNGGHAQPHFMADAQYLSHGDDPYDVFTWAGPPIPQTEFFTPKAMFDSWFGPGVPAAQVASNVGRRPIDLAIQYLSFSLLRDYCADMAAGTPHASGKVAADLSKVYTVAELEAQNLWSRMDEKLNSIGGCKNVPSP